MCGLFGMAGVGIQRKDFDILDELMLVSSTRGTDGCGVSVGKSYVDAGPKKAKTFKLVGDPFYWKWTLGKAEPLIYDISNTWFIGHTRYRSVGEVNQESAQPFVFNNIVGTHNGTVQGSYKPFNTDSEKLLSRIDILGPEKVIPTLTEKDAYALVWYNFKKKELHFIRNARRELWFAQNRKRSVLYWASEERFLDFALEGETYKKYYFEPDVHHILTIGDIKYTKTVELHQYPLKPEPPIEIVEDNVVVFDQNNSSVMGESWQDLQDIPWLHNRPNSPTKRSMH